MTTFQALIVDDNAINRQLLAAILVRLGWQAHAVETGEEALSYLSQHPIDLVLLDLRLPGGLNGEDIVRLIRADEKLAGLPVVACTAHSHADEKARMVESGFDDVLIKPVSVDRLRHICANLPHRLS